MIYLISRQDGRKFKLEQPTKDELYVWQFFGGEMRCVNHYEGALIVASAISTIRQEIFDGKLFELKAL